MSEEFGGLILNLTKTPIRRKKKQSEENYVESLEKQNIVFSRPQIQNVISNKYNQQKPAVNQSKIKPKSFESAEPPSSTPNGILKKSTSFSSHSIWKKFKESNKRHGSKDLTFEKTKVNFTIKKNLKTVNNSNSSGFENKPKKVSFSANDSNKQLSDFDKLAENNVISNEKAKIVRKDKNNFLESNPVCSDFDSLGKKKKSNKLKFFNDGDNYDLSSLKLSNEKKECNTGKITSLFYNNPEIPEIPRRLIKPVKEDVFSNVSFEDLNLHPYMIKYLKESMNLTTATTIQAKSIPILLENHDALIRSQTGSGKTLAFALPMLHKLQEVRPKIKRADGVLALIILPTRELVLQTYEIFSQLVRSYTWIVPGYLVGGEKRKSEKARLRKGITILIGTPGRLIDHVQHTKVLNLNKVKWLIIDEADRLLDMGYERDVALLLDTLNSNGLDSTHLGETPENESKSRQTILLSATLSPKVQKLAGLSLKKPVFVDAVGKDLKSIDHVPLDSIDVETETDTMVLPYNLTQKYMVIPPKLKLVSLASYILSILISDNEVNHSKKLLIFMGTQDMVDYYTELLSCIFGSSESGNLPEFEDLPQFSISDVELFKLHGNMKQPERTEVFKVFRKSTLGILLCTDVAARGLDLPEVDWVIQFTGPISVSDYVHRVGRTARGGQSGFSIIFLTPNEVGFIGKLENCQIRVEEEKMETCLNYLVESDAGGRNTEEEATKLQMKFEKLVADDRKLYDLACKAYASWSRFYATYPKNMRDAFSVKAVHQGHLAKSFALRDTPSSIVSYARTKNLNEKKFPRKRFDEKPGRDRKMDKFKGGKRTLQISEFDSGLEPLTKKKKTMK